ncbi:MAG: hypothetical protein PUB97_08745 [Ruminococcus sp.]|nr:hypothetical protein [Ruminococcus sp.]
MSSTKITLAGIILILASLFCMGICILNSEQGGPQGLTVLLFATGVIISIIGLFLPEHKD